MRMSMGPATDRARSQNEVTSPGDVKSARLAVLQDLLKSQQSAFNQASIGRCVDVLLERVGRKPGQLVGRTPYLQAIHLDAPADHMGKIVSAEIIATLSNSLQGALIRHG